MVTIKPYIKIIHRRKENTRMDDEIEMAFSLKDSGRRTTNLGRSVADSSVDQCQTNDLCGLKQILNTTIDSNKFGFKIARLMQSRYPN